MLFITLALTDCWAILVSDGCVCYEVGVTSWLTPPIYEYFYISCIIYLDFFFLIYNRTRLRGTSLINDVF